MVLKSNTAGKRGKNGKKDKHKLRRGNISALREVRSGKLKITLRVYSSSDPKIHFRFGAWQTEKIIVKELADEIVKGSEAGVTKISKGLFRFAVEVEMIIMILSELADIPPEVMNEYRKEAIKNVRRTRGKINLDDLIARNNRELAERKIEERSDKNSDYESEYVIDDSLFWD